MFTLRAVDDEQITVGSNDSGDIARIFRLLGYDLPIERGTRIEYVFVTIYKTLLTAENSNAKISNDQPELDSGAQPELPF